MITRAASCLWFDPLKSKTAEIKLVNENIDHSHRVVLGNVIFKAFGKQGDLVAVFAFNKTLHD